MLRPLPTVWRQEELDHINSTTSGAERKAALCALLEKEAELIAGIGQHRLVAGQAAQDRAGERFLEAVSRHTRSLTHTHTHTHARLRLPRSG